MNTSLQLRTVLHKNAIEKITGVPVQVRYEAGKAILYWKEDDRKKMQAIIRMQLQKSKKPTDISYDIEPVLRPVYIEKIAPYVIGLLGIGMAAGFFIKRGL